MIEYIITVLEFFIVAGLSALLIPFYFIDATKQFATNILKTIFTYAIKLITTITMVFFTLGMYINLGNFMLQRTELTALSTVFIYVFYCVIGMALVKGTGGLAASIISGNPSIGLRDVSAGLHSMAHGARVINGAANAAWNTGTKAFQAGVSGGMGAAATLDGAAAARNAALENARYQNALLKMQNPEATGMTEKQMQRAANASYWQSIGGSMKQSVGDSLYKGLTGQEKKRNEMDGKTLSFGETFTDKEGHQRKADFGDIKDAAVTKGQNIGKENVDKFFEPYNESAMKTKHLPDNNQDVWWNK